MSGLAVVVSFSSNERMFLRAQLRELLKTSAQEIVYSVGTRLFDMRAEDASAVPAAAQAESAEPGRVRVATYVVEADVLREPRKYHNLARAAGVRALGPDARWVLLLDADEVPDGAAFDAFYKQSAGRLSANVAYKLQCYWYFIRPTWRAQTREDSVLLVHRDHLTDEALADPAERDGIVRRCPGGALRDVPGLDGQALFHHYSWVRGSAELKHKVRTWGHRHDRADWEGLVDAALSRSEPPPEGDFVHGYRYTVVPSLLG